MIYFDNAATTAASEKTASTLAYYAREKFFNPSARYRKGIEVKNDLESARRKLLILLRGEGNIIFTAGGTESDNLAMFGTRKRRGAEIIISAAEHSAIYASAMELKQQGYNILICPTDRAGRVDEAEFSRLVSINTALISILHINNETGAINDIGKLCHIAKSINPKVVFHSDGVQAVGKITVNLQAMGVDLYSISAHKIHGVKGAGALFVKKGVGLAPRLFGGGQEGGLRSSTENTGGIISLANAAEDCISNLTARTQRVAQIKEYLLGTLSQIDGFLPISDENSSYFILTFSLPKVRGEVMQHALEKRDMLIGTGSACSSGKAEKRIADALMLQDSYRDGIVRLSFSGENTLDEAKVFAEEFIKIYEELEKYGGK
ncbi:MAG: cysteine desulfurase family protein [Clostridia bacterium]